ncbi:MAG: 4'-phosphopantetheinyl transferase family protein [Alcaligenes sp.]
MQRIPLPKSLACAVEIHRLDLRLGEEPRDAWPVLTSAEREATVRYHFCADRVRFAATRATVRVLLSRELGCAPQAIDIVSGPHRKPEVRGINGRPVSGAPLFNVSHSGGFALIAIGKAQRLGCLGVDIERCDPSLDPYPIAELGCTEREWDFLRGATNPRDMLYSMWVAKEAVLKAVGVGIPDHLQSVSIELKPWPEIGVTTDMHGWRGLQARALVAPYGYVAAVAWNNKEEM